MPGGQKHNYDQDRRAHDGRQISEAEIKIIAAAAADMAISNLFEVFGVDTTTKEGRKGLQDDFTFLRDAREGTAGMRKTGWFAIIGTVVTAALLALWKGVTILAAYAARAG